MHDVVIGILAGLIGGGAFCAVAVDARGQLRRPHLGRAIAAPVIPTSPELALPSPVDWTADDIDVLIESLTADLHETLPALPTIEVHDAEVIAEHPAPRVPLVALAPVMELTRVAHIAESVADEVAPIAAGLNDPSTDVHAPTIWFDPDADGLRGMAVRF